MKKFLLILSLFFFSFCLNSNAALKSGCQLASNIHTGSPTVVSLPGIFTGNAYPLSPSISSSSAVCLFLTTTPCAVFSTSTFTGAMGPLKYQNTNYFYALGVEVSYSTNKLDCAIDDYAWALVLLIGSAGFFFIKNRLFFGV